MGISDKLKGGLTKHGKNDYNFEDSQLRPNKHSDGAMYSAPTGTSIAPPVQPVQDSYRPQQSFDHQQPAYTNPINERQDFNQAYRPEPAAPLRQDNYAPQSAMAPAAHDFVDGRPLQQSHHVPVQDTSYVPPTGTSVMHDRPVEQSFQNLNVHDQHIPPTGTAVPQHHGHHGHHGHHNNPVVQPPLPPRDNIPGSERPAPTPQNTESHLGYVPPTGTHVPPVPVPAHVDRRDSPELGYVPPSGTAVKLVPAKTADGLIKEDRSAVPAPIDQTIGNNGHLDHHIGFTPKVMHKCHSCGVDNDISNYFRKEAVYRIS